MNIKTLFLSCSIICLYNANNNTQEYHRDTLAWFYQEIKQSTNDAFNNPEIVNNIDLFISLLEKKIKLLEEKINKSPNAIKELRKNTILYTAQVIIAGVATCFMFDHKEKILTYVRPSLGEFGNSLLFGTLLFSTCFLKIKQLDAIAAQQTYVKNLSSELDNCKQLLATLQLLQNL